MLFNFDVYYYFFVVDGEKNEDIQGNNGTLSIFIEDYELQIPCDWMIKSVYSYQKAGSASITGRCTGF